MVQDAALPRLRQRKIFIWTRTRAESAAKGIRAGRKNGPKRIHFTVHNRILYRTASQCITTLFKQFQRILKNPI